MLRFGVGEEGSCGFADADRFRFFIYWRPQKSPPRLEQDRDRFLKKISQTQTGEPRIVSPPIPHWTGWEIVCGKRRIRQFAHHDATSGMALTAVFTDATEAKDGVVEEADILRSITIRRPAKEEDRIWKIADFTCLTPSGYPLQGALFQPGKTVLTFRANPRKEPVFTASRYSLVNEWLPSGNIEGWLNRQCPDGFQPESMRKATLEGHDLIGLTARARHRWAPLRQSPRRFFEIIGWICPVDQALYVVSRQLFAPDPSWENPAALPLRCCPAGPGKHHFRSEEGP